LHFLQRTGQETLSNKGDTIQCYVTSTFAKELKIESNAVYISDISKWITSKEIKMDRRSWAWVIHW